MELTEAYQLMYDELDSTMLEVGLAPAPEPMHSGHMIRVCMSINPRWYRDFCARYPSTRKGKTRTKIKRRDTLKILSRLAAGKTTTSQYAGYFEVIAQRICEKRWEEENNPF